MGDREQRWLDAANKRLKNSGCAAKILARGNKLSLRATVPAKPGQGNKPSQKVISLGLYFNDAGIKMAEIKAQKLSGELALDKFSWDDWLKKNKGEASTEKGEIVKSKTIADWTEEFEADYFARRPRTPATESTFRVEYRAMFSKMPPDIELTADFLHKFVIKYPPDKRQRKRACMVASVLAKFAKIEIDLSPYRGNYNSAIVPKDIPTDRQIVEWYHSIPNPAWQYVFGIMAAYGISNHELFYCNLESLRESPGHLESHYRKNHYGVRRIWCLYPQWWEQFELNKPRELPKITGKDNQAKGSRITRAFSRYGLCRPTWIRHAWAIRAMDFMPDALAARQMAHTLKVHNETYQRWINQEKEDRMYRILMQRGDLPTPPTI